MLLGLNEQSLLNIDVENMTDHDVEQLLMFGMLDPSEVSKMDQLLQTSDDNDTDTEPAEIANESGEDVDGLDDGTDE